MFCGGSSLVYHYALIPGLARLSTLAASETRKRLGDFWGGLAEGLGSVAMPKRMGESASKTFQGLAHPPVIIVPAAEVHLKTN
jgi:hypothetical protein